MLSILVLHFLILYNYTCRAKKNKKQIAVFHQENSCSAPFSTRRHAEIGKSFFLIRIENPGRRCKLLQNPVRGIRLVAG